MGSIVTSEQVARLSEELDSLTRKQFEALQHLPYHSMPETEAWSYDRRRKRIAEISDLLAKLRRRPE